MCSKINAFYIFVFIFSRYANTQTAKFRKVVRQHTERMEEIYGFVGNLILFPEAK